MPKPLTYFSGLTLRERSLLLSLAWLVLLLWLSVLLKHTSSTLSDLSETGQTLEMQRIYLQNRETVSSKLEVAGSRLNPEKTIDSDALFTQIDSLARKHGFSFDLGSPRHEQSDLFTIHSIRLGVKQAPLQDIIAFVQEIRGQSPYLNLAAFRLTPTEQDPALLNAQLEVQSFEFTRTL